MLWLSILLLMLLGAVLVALVAVTIVSLLFIFPMARGAVYVPSSDEAISTMLQLARIKPGMLTADLGSGDGRVVKAFAQKGAQADGFEINPWLVWKSRQVLKSEKLASSTHIYPHSYWQYDLSQYDVICLYGITYIMESLEKKLLKELRPGALVLSNYFTFPNWKPIKTVNGVHLYRVPR